MHLQLIQFEINIKSIFNLIINNKNFTKFINKLQKISKDKNVNFIYTYIQEIDNQSFNKYFNLILMSDNFYFWKNPEKNYSFISNGCIYKLKKNHYKKIKHIHNFKKTDFDFYPLFIGGIKFPTSEKTDLWKDYSKEIWYVPELSFITFENKFYFAINFLNKTIKVDLPQKLNEKFKTIINRQNKLHTYKTLNDSKNNSTTYFQWTKNVDTVLKKIKKEELQKVVIARLKKIKLNRIISIKNVIEKLIEDYPECYIFIWHNNKSTFLGATPELLGKFRKNKFETDALAGSIKRGKDKNEDQLLEYNLLNDNKNLNEHVAVLNYLLKKLSHMAENVTFKQTKVKKLKNIQHLWTPVKTEISKEIPIITIIKNIHPTPAVCGLPKNKALKIIDKSENFDRGLYAGTLGWFNLRRNGEFIVSIRSALIKNSYLYLFAGSGIVDGSSIKSEYEETELKLKPMISLFKSRKK